MEKNKVDMFKEELRNLLEQYSAYILTKATDDEIVIYIKERFDAVYIVSNKLD